jgi:hypothetical protein
VPPTATVSLVLRRLIVYLCFGTGLLTRLRCSQKYCIVLNEVDVWL